MMHVQEINFKEGNLDRHKSISDIVKTGSVNSISKVSDAGSEMNLPVFVSMAVDGESHVVIEDSMSPNMSRFEKYDISSVSPSEGMTDSGSSQSNCLSMGTWMKRAR